MSASVIAGLFAEIAELRIGVPRRHLARENARLHRASPRPGVGEGHQRHRATRRPVAGAQLRKDGGDVLISERAGAS